MKRAWLYPTIAAAASLLDLALAGGDDAFTAGLLVGAYAAFIGSRADRANPHQPKHDQI